MRKQKGITLIALIITIIILLILAGISIAMLTGENGILKKAMDAKEQTEIQAYYEKIELIRNELRLEKENYAPPSIAEMKDEFDKHQTDWVASTEIKQVDGIETLELKTKEGYIFHITEMGTEYKGKGKVVDTSALKREDALKLEIVGEGTSGGKLVQITDLSGVDYYKIEYQINATDGNWITVESGKSVDVPPSATIYARLTYETSKGVIVSLSIGASAPTIVAKNTDTSQVVRKTQTPLVDLFEITWGSDGTGTVEYSVTGNLNFKNTTFNSTEISSLSELEIGNYTVTCKVTSPSNKQAMATKQNIEVTKLANTTVTNASNSNVTASAIYSEYDLAYFRDLVNGGQSNMNGKAMNDIPLTIVSSVENEGWVPIGYWEGITDWVGPHFAGIFDGDGHAITVTSIANMTSTSKHREGGLFGMIIGGRVEKLTVNGTISSNASSGVGGIVGDIKDGTIYQCTNNATITGSSGEACGGMAGTTMNSIIEECTNNGNVNGKTYVGGMVGWAYEASVIKNCKNKASVKCKEAVTIGFYDSNKTMCFGGGIVGRAMKQCKIETCTNEGKVIPKGEPIPANYVCLGGIAGEIDNGCTIRKSNNKGEISYRINDNGLIGGIAGYSVDQSIVEQCFNKGTIAGRYDSTRGVASAGGIIGWNDGSTIKNCYNVASVEGNENIGGLAGGTDSKCSLKKGYVYNCYSATTSILGNVCVGTFMGQLSDVEIKNCCFITDTTYNGKENSGITWTSWKFLKLEEMKTANSGLLTMLNSDEVLWKQDTTKNDGLPYLINNLP